MNELEKLKFPIGPFKRPEKIQKEDVLQWRNDIDAFPELIKSAVSNLNDAQLNTKYRPEGWTLHQVVHHCADSHMNGYGRLKLALTEDQPTIKPYLEAKWAELPDTLDLPVAVSLQLLEIIHFKWCFLIDRLCPSDYSRTYLHPEHGAVFRLDESIGIYAWHCRHHLAHITETIKREGWKTI